jgi:hypothetical protein
VVAAVVGCDESKVRLVAANGAAQSCVVGHVE